MSDKHEQRDAGDKRNASDQKDLDLYAYRFMKLVAAVKQHYEWDMKCSPTPLRKRLTAAAKKMNEVIAFLDATPDFEAFHDARPQPSWPPKEGEDYKYGDWPLYQDIRRNMLLLEESARMYGECLPDSRQRRALPFAALGLLYLRHRHGYEPLKLSIDSEHVQELERLCTAAGMLPLERETLRNALRDSKPKFNRDSPEPVYWPILQ
ncbi:MAG TPA: hypothetical protein VJ673_24475 [Aromatoleum sp.]|uniref:hypothetical protein n=1 Tax=Aromatoleum sp. TaxID=2307007 RepID=UPI002B49FCC2|nr:hypothetical protein [Aromatoleum sp.]HJV28854.1 hypothetical protein [Aromatoleum sp.]